MFFRPELARFWNVGRRVRHLVAGQRAPKIGTARALVIHALRTIGIMDERMGYVLAVALRALPGPPPIGTRRHYKLPW